jgi:hypothetical protein
MNAVPFDTLKLAQRLEAAGMAAPVAAGASEALAEAMSGAELATKSDLKALESSLRVDMAALRSEMRGDNGSLRVELKNDMEILKRDLTIRLGGMMMFGVGITLTALRLMLHP